jgi:hypothetical protein
MATHTAADVDRRRIAAQRAHVDERGMVRVRLDPKAATDGDIPLARRGGSYINEPGAFGIPAGGGGRDRAAIRRANPPGAAARTDAAVAKSAEAGLCDRRLGVLALDAGSFGARKCRRARGRRRFWDVPRRPTVALSANGSIRP